MIREIELRRRVERLINGEFRPDDFTRLFLWLRHRAYGISSVTEIGHFVAHSGERELGPVTNHVRDFFDFLRLRTRNLNAKIDLKDVPSSFPQVIRSNFARLSSRLIERDTGLTRKNAELVMKAALSKFGSKDNGGKYLKNLLSSDEESLIQCTASYIISQPSFTDETLLRDFLFLLERNRLIATKERHRLKKLKAPLALFAIASMHFVTIVMKDDWTASLHGFAPEGLLIVGAAAEPWEPDPGFVIYPVFGTTLKAADWCAPEILELPLTTNLWMGPIEMTSEPKLVPL